MTHQFILGANQEPLFAIIPYAEYQRFIGTQSVIVAPTRAAGEITRSIRLPNGGPSAAIDLPSFVDYWCRKGILCMPISQRAKPLREFESRERFSVEAMVRMCFVSESYRNTMQVTTEVAGELIATGLFRLVKLDRAQMQEGYSYEGQGSGSGTRGLEAFSRSVKCLEFIVEAAEKYLRENPMTNPPLENWEDKVPR